MLEHTRWSGSGPCILLKIDENKADSQQRRQKEHKSDIRRIALQRSSPGHLFTRSRKSKPSDREFLKETKQQLAGCYSLINMRV